LQLVQLHATKIEGWYTQNQVGEVYGAQKVCKVHQSPAVLYLSLAVGLSIASTYELHHQYIKILMCVSVTNRSGGLEGETHVTFVLTVYCVMNGSGSSVGGLH